MKKIFVLFACTALISHAAAFKQLTVRDLENNLPRFSIYVEEEIVPQIKILAPDKDASSWTKFKGGFASFGASTFGPLFTKYSALEIEGAKQLSTFCADSNKKARAATVAGLPSREEDLAFINNLLQALELTTDGDSRALTCHTATIEFLKNHGALPPDTTLTFKDMNKTYINATPALLNQLFTNHLFAQFVREKQPELLTSQAE